MSSKNSENDIILKNKKGEWHNESGPAIIRYHKDGVTVKAERYCINGLFHRENGPACIDYDEDGNIINSLTLSHQVNYWEQLKNWRNLDKFKQILKRL